MIYTKAYRESLGLSQSALAEYLGCGVRAVQEWDQGLRKPPESSIRLMRMHTRNAVHWSDAIRYCKKNKLDFAKTADWIRAVEATR